MAVAYECPECLTAWPHYRAFASCPECRIACRVTMTPRALTTGQAHSRIRQLEFERYYNARELWRTGPTPEQLGVDDARREIEQVRKLNETIDDPGD